MFSLRVLTLLYLIAVDIRLLECNHFYGVSLSADQNEDPSTGLVTVTMYWRQVYNPVKLQSNTVNTCDPCPSTAGQPAKLDAPSANCDQTLTTSTGDHYVSMTGVQQVGWYLSSTAPAANSYSTIEFDYSSGVSWGNLVSSKGRRGSGTK